MVQTTLALFIVCLDGYGIEKNLSIHYYFGNNQLIQLHDWIIDRAYILMSTKGTLAFVACSEDTVKVFKSKS